MQTFNTAPKSLAKYDPNLRDLMDVVTDEILLALNCHAIGTVQSFNPANNTVSVTINYSKTFFKKDPTTGNYNPVQVNYPPLATVPIYILGDGAACSLTFPIKVGATCSVLFHDRDISAWFASGQVGPLPSNAKHAFSDAIALIGVRPLTNVIASYDTVRAVLQNGTTMVGVGPAKVKVANAATTLNTQLQNLLTALSTFGTACEGSSTDPVLVSAATALVAALVPVTTGLGGLLE